MGNKSTRENSAAQSDETDAEVAITPEQKSYWAMAKQGYQELVHAIIRPPRCKYEMSQLGPKEFDFCGKTFQRSDFELRNARGLKIVCSMWEPVAKDRPNPILPCVIYMHGNASARLEAMPQLPLVLSLGATLLSFDFCGSGASDGDYVSLGAFEKDDLQAVIEHLRTNGTTSTIALWGRSMGATTALLHGERDPSIAGMVLDSAFADLQMLAEEMVEKGRQHGLFAPSLLVKLAIRFIRSSVQKEANFDIRSLSPIEHADKCFIPALFVAAEGDEFVPPHHSQQIYMKYAGDKNVIIVDGDHNTPRPRFMQDSAAIFLAHTLQTPESWLLQDAQRYFGLLPWNVHRKKASNGMAPHQHVSTGAPGELDQEILDELSALGISEEELEIGMTAERQADIQNRLNRLMLGGGTGATGKKAGKTSSTAGNNNTSSENTKVSGDTDSLPPPPIAIVSSDEGDADEQEQSAKIRLVTSDLSNPFHPPIPPPLAVPSDADSPNTKPVKPNKPPKPSPSSSPSLQSEWTCDTCTLINSPTDQSCAACGMPHPSLA